MALRRIMRPLLRICLRAGVSVAQLRAELDHAAVREAEAYLLENKKKPTYSNISIITGIQRRLVASLLNANDADSAPRSIGAMHRAVRVLNGWHEDPGWMTRLGTPATLEVRGEGRTFETLTHKYAGGVSPTAILDRLVETNTVRVMARDQQGRPSRVRPLQPTIAPDVNETRLLDEFGIVYGEALEMFDANLRCASPAERMRPYTVTATVVEPSVRAIRRQLKERGEFVESVVDQALSRYDVSGDARAVDAKRGPDGLYSIRVSMFCTIRPTAVLRPPIENAWRRESATTQEQQKVRTRRSNGPPARS
jgi:hypothetical protein